MTDQPDDVGQCALCGRRWAEDEDERPWLSIEIMRSNGPDCQEWLNKDFCTQAHAATWMREPLPAPVFDQPTFKRSWRDRLVDLGITLAIGSLFALAVFGLFAAIALVFDVYPSWLS